MFSPTFPSTWIHLNSWKSHWNVHPSFSSVLSSAYFNILGVHTSCWVDKLNWMVYCVVLSHIRQRIICSHSSDHTIVPGTTFCCITGSSVAAEWSSTARTIPKAGVTDVSTIPNTQYGFAGARPQWLCGGDHHMHALQARCYTLIISLHKPNALTLGLCQ